MARQSHFTYVLVTHRLLFSTRLRVVCEDSQHHFPHVVLFPGSLSKVVPDEKCVEVISCPLESRPRHVTEKGNFLGASSRRLAAQDETRKRHQCQTNKQTKLSRTAAERKLPQHSGGHLIPKPLKNPVQELWSRLTPRVERLQDLTNVFLA